MFPGNGNMKVGSLEEELRSEGLKPNKMLDEIERNIRLMEAGSSPTSASGLQEGTQVDRTLRDRGKTLVENAPGNRVPPAGKRSAAALVLASLAEDADDEVLDQAFESIDFETLTEAELVEFGGMLKRMKSAVQRRLARRGPAYKRKLRIAKVYARRHKGKIKRRMKKLLAKVGGWSVLKKLRSMTGKGKRRSYQKADRDDVLANLREELSGSSAVESGTSPFEIAAIQGGYLCHQLGEIFEELGDAGAAEALYRVADFAADLSEEMERTLTESDEEIPEALEHKLNSVLEASTKALAAWEKLGCPSLWEAADEAEENAEAE